MIRATTITMAILAIAMAGVTVKWAGADSSDNNDKAPKNLVRIEGMSYSPARITITAGEIVTWKNFDERDHTIKGENGSFDSGTIRSGGTFKHRFTRAGTYPYACAFHPREKGVVVVE